MNEITLKQYVPDYLVTPGEVLEEYLNAYGMTPTELAKQTGLDERAVNDVIQGKAPITPATALKLERALGRPVHFWNNLERQFQEDRARLGEDQSQRPPVGKKPVVLPVAH